MYQLKKALTLQDKRPTGFQLALIQINKQLLNKYLCGDKLWYMIVPYKLVIKLFNSENPDYHTSIL